MDIYGLIGKSLKHSFSSNYFGDKFRCEDIQAEYRNFELQAISEIKNLLRNKNLMGFNVTIPYKTAIIPYLNFVYAPISLLNAVNTVRVVHEAERPVLYAFNTDVYGFYHSLKPLLKAHHRKALILGTGGAAKAVAFVLDKLEISYLFISRDRAKGMLYSELDQYVLTYFTLIINTSPVGQFPDTEKKPDIPYEFLSSEHLLYDLIYNPEETVFLKEGRKHRAQIKNGLEMLHLQAEKAWKIFQSENLAEVTLF